MMGLEGRELVKRYGGRAVVDRLSLVVEPGQIVGLLGPNGAGKTTTFSLIMGFMSADHGSVLLDGADISSLPFYRRARLGIGYLPQEPSVFTKATVRQNLDMALEGAASPEAHRDRLLEEFHLAPLADQLAGSLSSGERRRLEIARSLSKSPRYVLLDEPFSGIDPISIANLQAEIRSLKERGIGIIITDHNVRDTLTITDFAYLIDQGRQVTAGTPPQVVADPAARRVYLGEAFQP
ncbi:MAG: LPS export ABC transporter ATP-binding protein [Candidatus Bipolaricaulota bacterium]|nr:LPS export ABC transporter ATP-binding protein [Candidatus Bipolaricaulota bacterium]